MEAFIIPLSIYSFVSVNDSKEHCLISALKYLQKDGYTILGMKKTARGNSHDESWQDHYTVIDDGGIFADFFNKEKERKSSLYVDVPIIKYIDNLSEEEMERWSKPYEAYSGEETYRYIYAMEKNKKYIFEVKEVFIKKENKCSDEEWRNWELRKQIHTIKVSLCAE
jgi:hypothetical protein